MDDAQLKTIWQQRRPADAGTPLSAPLSLFMKRVLAKRVRQLSALAFVWDELVPEAVRDHTALESFVGGTLTVTVDSASHRFQLKTLLDGGLLKQIQSRLPMALNKVRLVPGQFYTDVNGEQRYEF